MGKFRDTGVVDTTSSKKMFYFVSGYLTEPEFKSSAEYFKKLEEGFNNTLGKNSGFTFRQIPHCRYETFMQAWNAKNTYGIILHTHGRLDTGYPLLWPDEGYGNGKELNPYYGESKFPKSGNNLKSVAFMSCNSLNFLDIILEKTTRKDIQVKTMSRKLFDGTKAADDDMWRWINYRTTEPYSPTEGAESLFLYAADKFKRDPRWEEKKTTEKKGGCFGCSMAPIGAAGPPSLIDQLRMPAPGTISADHFALDHIYVKYRTIPKETRQTSVSPKKASPSSGSRPTSAILPALKGVSTLKMLGQHLIKTWNTGATRSPIPQPAVSPAAQSLISPTLRGVSTLKMLGEHLIKTWNTAAARSSIPKPKDSVSHQLSFSVMDTLRKMEQRSRDYYATHKNIKPPPMPALNTIDALKRLEQRSQAYYATHKNVKPPPMPVFGTMEALNRLEKRSIAYYEKQKKAPILSQRQPFAANQTSFIRPNTLQILNRHLMNTWDKKTTSAFVRPLPNATFSQLRPQPLNQIQLLNRALMKK
jgi:hypothetical protein